MPSSPKLVDFFIVGAPRCGTTAMSSYLSQHPEVSFADPKEPLFFCTDLPGLQTASNLQEYEGFFQSSAGKSTIRGEGSVWYLYSQTAIPRIVEYNANAKFIVMLRNPIDMLASLHQKLIFFLDEDQIDFRDAWRLQEARTQGKSLPAQCREPKILAYREIAMFSQQLRRALTVVDPAKLHIILFEDFEQNPRSSYLDVLSFLGLADDHREDFPAVNSNRKVVNLKALQALSKPYPWLMATISRLKQSLGIERLGVLPRLRDALTPEAQRGLLDDEFRSQLVHAFSNETEQLQSLLDRDLSHWTNP